MNKSEFKHLLLTTHARLLELTNTKGEEYARSDDQLANFKRAAEEAGIRPDQAWLVFFNKHIDSIKHYIRGGTVTEDINSRIDDALLYLILYKAIVNERA